MKRLIHLLLLFLTQLALFDFRLEAQPNAYALTYTYKRTEETISGYNRLGRPQYKMARTWSFEISQATNWLETSAVRFDGNPRWIIDITEFKAPFTGSWVYYEKAFRRFHWFGFNPDGTWMGNETVYVPNTSNSREISECMIGSVTMDNGSGVRVTQSGKLTLVVKNPTNDRYKATAWFNAVLKNGSSRRALASWILNPQSEMQLDCTPKYVTSILGNGKVFFMTWGGTAFELLPTPYADDHPVKKTTPSASAGWNWKGGL